MHPLTRLLRQKEGLEPSFPISICEQTFEHAKQWINKVGFVGYCALAVDDMKLHPALRTYWDSKKSQYILMGTAGEPPVIANEEELEKMLDTAKVNKATKVSPR